MFYHWIIMGVEYGVLQNQKKNRKNSLKYIYIYILCVKYLTSDMAVYGELGRYPLYISRYVQIIFD